MKKYAETLAKSYELEDRTANGFFNYIVESLINGNRNQVKELFNEMKPESQREFLVDFLNPSEGYHKSTLNICIAELTK